MKKHLFASACSFAATLTLVGCERPGVEEVSNISVAEAEGEVDRAAIDGAAETPSGRTARLREKAKTDPDGADAEAIANMPRTEIVATAINSAGFLCARVTRLQSVGSGQMLVDCVERRDGTGRVSYRVDANSGTVEQR